MADGKHFGCSHYFRRCKLVMPCCNQSFTCRFCHDNTQNHPVDRKRIRHLICLNCNTEQAVRSQCEICGIQFGEYSCLECCLFDDEDKQQFHCLECGVCRVGGAENYFHCLKCNVCVLKQLKVVHDCVEYLSKQQCTICAEDLYYLKLPLYTMPDCGHVFHKYCYDEIQDGGFECSTCRILYTKTGSSSEDTV